MPVGNPTFTKAIMRRYELTAALCALLFSPLSSTLAQEESSTPVQQETVCFESRLDASKVTQTQIGEDLPNVRCSDKTSGVLWWGDPFHDTIPMGEMPLEADYTHGEAVVKPRTTQLALFSFCGGACHNGSFPAPVEPDAPPRQLTMHTDIVPDALDLQHGNGGVWCLDCHDAKTRTKLVDNAGGLIDFNQPQQLCGKCHGQVYSDWRDGLHGKRIGEWATTGKKRWFVCTECHNPHDVQQGARQYGVAQIEPEAAPRLPKGLENADHERHGAH